MKGTRMGRRRSWIAIGLSGVVVAVASVAAIMPASAGEYFGYNGASVNRLPSDDDCARRVRADSRPENKSANYWFNRTTGRRLSGNEFERRVTGNFTGSTEDILRWGACKWGVDENAVKAQAVVESWWNQNNRGGAHGILQVERAYNEWVYFGGGGNVSESTAMNVDYALMRWRECEAGRWTWLNTVERGWNYGPGDGWGCLGVWGTGKWHTWAANEYIGRVQHEQRVRQWETNRWFRQ
ncbi:MAG TPA: hypothetical protein VFO77_03985 [Actinoplanes sp.]|nr:hypothetical protein [Actinoplanes sp.]